jgi:hypothetical protein
MSLATIPQPQATPNRMSSREVAELTGKQHSNVMRDIREMRKNLDESKTGFVCERATYIANNGHERPMFMLCHDFARLLERKYDGLARVPLRLQEEAALKTIEQLLGIKLKRQYPVLCYRIDGYDAVNNVAYEIDENSGHDTAEKMANDKYRAQTISEYLDCKFVRIQL